MRASHQDGTDSEEPPRRNCRERECTIPLSVHNLMNQDLEIGLGKIAYASVACTILPKTPKRWPLRVLESLPRRVSSYSLK